MLLFFIIIFIGLVGIYVEKSKRANYLSVFNVKGNRFPAFVLFTCVLYKYYFHFNGLGLLMIIE